jgi:hypothetical protein
MNRIRKVNNKFQVLLAPHQKYNTGFEFLLGSWTDEAITGFEVKEYVALYDAECEALQQPDINWVQLVDYHKDAYLALKQYIHEIIDQSELTVQIKCQLMTPENAKNKMFDRVIKGHLQMNENNDMSGFRLPLDMNDIISFSIVNPWTKNLRELERHLVRTSRLNIFNRLEKNGTVHLIGRTDIGTTYEILLVPTIVNNWMEWRLVNKKTSVARQYGELKKCLDVQKMIDDTVPLR